MDTVRIPIVGTVQPDGTVRWDSAKAARRWGKSEQPQLSRVISHKDTPAGLQMLRDLSARRGESMSAVLRALVREAHGSE